AGRRFIVARGAVGTAAAVSNDRSSRVGVVIVFSCIDNSGGVNMRILVIGSGAREHALTWKLAQSQRVTKLYAAPGNPGMASIAQCVPIAVTHLPQLADFAERSHLAPTAVGPELPLVAR